MCSDTISFYSRTRAAEAIRGGNTRERVQSECLLTSRNLSYISMIALCVAVSANRRLRPQSDIPRVCAKVRSAATPDIPALLSCIANRPASDIQLNQKRPPKGPLFVLVKLLSSWLYYTRQARTKETAYWHSIARAIFTVLFALNSSNLCIVGAKPCA